MSGPPLARVRRAYEQIADQLRELILTGKLESGARLPTESELASSFGVSRATVREALRMLAAENLIRTGKGPAGGSFVIRPSAAQLAGYLSANIRLLASANDISLANLLEAREQLEGPAARLAAERRGEEDVERLHGAIPLGETGLDVDEQFAANRDFHSILVDAAGNPLLKIAVQPIFMVLQSHLTRDQIGARDNRMIAEGHERIAAAVQAADPDAAEAAMGEHLADLRPLYERVWKRATAKV
jgi:GntR family transcriptional regulator, transcriptional repressor for pyruvate dehydrogenase complex